MSSKRAVIAPALINRYMDDSTAAVSNRSESQNGGRPCPICETPMYHRHCKYVCPNHGVVYDCSDTFY